MPTHDPARLRALDATIGYDGPIISTAGGITLDGKAVHPWAPKQVARELGLLPPTSFAPNGITVANLVGRGRAPYQSLFHQWRDSDEKAVYAALAATRTLKISDRTVEDLSGGQCQRVWIAMLQAQQTPIMLLDEPTISLNILHQYDLMELLHTFHGQGKQS